MTAPRCGPRSLPVGDSPSPRAPPAPRIPAEALWAPSLPGQELRMALSQPLLGGLWNPPWDLACSPTQKYSRCFVRLVFEGLLLPSWLEHPGF